jgi:alkylation response protein AidB-like acyl-CoA dehydrogenase
MRRIYGENAPRSTPAPKVDNGAARPVAGGYQVNGQWPLASGSSHATWLVGGCRIFDGDQPQLTPTGRPLARLMFLPMSAATILDTWHTAGLRGTASNDFLVRDLVVPAHRTCWFTHAPVRLEPQYRLPAIAFFAACIASVPLGIARHAIALFSASPALLRAVARGYQWFATPPMPSPWCCRRSRPRPAGPRG